MRTLIVFYSRTGTTKKVATTLSQMMNADLVEIQCKRYGPGFFHYMRAGYDSVRGNMAPIELSPAIQGSYDLAIIGAPIWAGHSAVPVRSFLKGDTDLPGNIGLFVTRMGSSPEKALQEMEAFLSSPAKAKLALKSKDVAQNKISDALDAFMAKLLHS